MEIGLEGVVVDVALHAFEDDFHGIEAEGVDLLLGLGRGIVRKAAVAPGEDVEELELGLLEEVLEEDVALDDAIGDEGIAQAAAKDFGALECFLQLFFADDALADEEVTEELGVVGAGDQVGVALGEIDALVERMVAQDQAALALLCPDFIEQVGEGLLAEIALGGHL